MKGRRIFKRKMEAIIIFMATLTLSFGLAACNSDDDEIIDSSVNKAPSAPDTRNGYDDLAIFQNSIVETDEDGNVVDFFYGDQLDATNPKHLFIGVENMKEAESMFRIWFAPDVEILQSENGLHAMLTDEQGCSQGAVFLSEGTEENHVAEVTFSADTQLKHFNKITFLKNSAWPISFQSTQNHYCKFDIVKDIELKGIVNDLNSDDKRLNVVCIQASGNGVKPIFCAISNHKYINPVYRGFVKRIRESKYCPGEGTTPTAFTIQKILLADWSGFVETFKEAGSGALVAETNYWYDKTSHFLIWEYNGVMDYHSGYTYGEDDSDVYYPFLFRVFGINDSAIYDGASV